MWPHLISVSSSVKWGQYFLCSLLWGLEIISIVVQHSAWCWDFLPVFSRYSVRVVPYAAVFFMYLWRERWCPQLYSSTIFNSYLSIFMITILISLLCRLLIFTFLNSSWVFSCFFIWNTLLCHIISSNSAFICMYYIGWLLSLSGRSGLLRKHPMGPRSVLPSPELYDPGVHYVWVACALLLW